MQTLAQLNALQAIYKAACKKHGVPCYGDLAKHIEAMIQEKGGKIDKISLIGPEVVAGSLKAALELAAGTPTVKNLACWNCSIGDEVCSPRMRFFRTGSILN